MFWSNHPFIATLDRPQVAQGRRGYAGSNNPFSVERDSVGKEQLLEPLPLFERRLHPQVGGARQNTFCERQDALHVEFIELAGGDRSIRASVSSSRSFSAWRSYVSMSIERSKTNASSRRSSLSWMAFRSSLRFRKLLAAAFRAFQIRNTDSLARVCADLPAIAAKALGVGLSGFLCGSRHRRCNWPRLMPFSAGTRTVAVKILPSADPELKGTLVLLSPDGDSIAGTEDELSNGLCGIVIRRIARRHPNHRG